MNSKNHEQLRWYDKALTLLETEFPKVGMVSQKHAWAASDPLTACRRDHGCLTSLAQLHGIWDSATTAQYRANPEHQCTVYLSRRSISSMTQQHSTLICRHAGLYSRTKRMVCDWWRPMLCLRLGKWLIPFPAQSSPNINHILLDRRQKQLAVQGRCADSRGRRPGTLVWVSVSTVVNLHPNHHLHWAIISHLSAWYLAL